jgi:hypothetical protein
MKPIHNYQWFAHKHTYLDLELLHLRGDMHLVPTPIIAKSWATYIIHVEKLDLKITLELKGTKLGTSRNVEKQQCLIICNLHKVEIFARFLFHISFNHIFSHVHIMEQKNTFHLQNQN